MTSHKNSKTIAWGGGLGCAGAEPERVYRSGDAFVCVSQLAALVPASVGTCDKASITTTRGVGSAAQGRNVGVGWSRGRLRLRERQLGGMLWCPILGVRVRIDGSFCLAGGSRDRCQGRAGEALLVVSCWGHFSTHRHCCWLWVRWGQWCSDEVRSLRLPEA